MAHVKVQERSLFCSSFEFLWTFVSRFPIPEVLQIRIELASGFFTFDLSGSSILAAIFQGFGMVWAQGAVHFRTPNFRAFVEPTSPFSPGST